MLQQKRHPRLPAYTHDSALSITVQPRLADRQGNLGMGFRHKKRINITRESRTRVLLTTQCRGLNHSPCISFTTNTLADVQNGRGNILLIQPIIKIKVFSKQAVSNASKIDAMVNGAFERQCAFPL